jgi:SSS family solute:Na+ symporter
MVGLVMAVLTAALVSTIGSSLNALSTVFTMDIYVKNINPGATSKDIRLMGRMVTIIGSLISILICVAVDLIKDIPLFNIFQSVLSFIAPPMAAVFVLGIFWKRCTTRAANFALTVGTVFCLVVGVLYLWLPEWLQFPWPHFMLLSFELFVILAVAMVAISLTDKDKTVYEIPAPVREGFSKLAVGLWTVLAIVMISLYVFFN